MVKLTTGDSTTITSEDKQPNWALSMAAAIPSGILKIGEGVATFGAALLDLGIDKDRVEAVEEYFDRINPFDEVAASTGIGKITELIVNIGVPGGLAFKAASGLGRATIAAQKAGTIVSKGEKARRFAQGAAGAGAAEGIVVGDVKDAGSFGDFLGGPTEINRDDDSAANELMNRLKFGIEGMAFTGAFGAAGKLVGKMREVRGSNKAKRGFDKSIEKLDSWFRSNGVKTIEDFQASNTMAGRIAADTNVGDVAMREIDKVSDKIAKSYMKVAVGKVPFLEAKKGIGVKLNDLLMSGSAANGKLKPIFTTVDEIKLNDKGETFKTGKQLYDVQLGQIDPIKKEILRKELITKYKADPEDVTKMFNQFGEVRDKWSELFTAMGRRFNPTSLKSFEDMVPKYINDVLDRGYEVLRNNPITLADNIRPTKTLIKEAVKEFQEIAAQKGMTLNDELARDMVDEVWKGAYLPKGFTVGAKTAPGQVRFEKGVPAFMTKSLANKITQKTIGDRAFQTNVSELSGVAKPVIQKLLGKAKNPMSSIVEGTANLSSMVRSNQFFDDLILRNNKLKTDYDAWEAGGRVGQEPRIPFLYNNSKDAMRYAGGTTDDFAEITSVKGDAVREIDRWADEAAFIKNIDDDDIIRTTAKGEIEQLINPLQGKFALKDYAEAFKSTQNTAKGLPRQIYNGLILYPKGLSQMSKTILAPFTHARNFISATAFASANGILPFGNTKDVKAAWNALQARGLGMRKDNAFYQELLELGVVNSNVKLKQIADLLEDVDFGGTLNRLNGDFGLGRFLKGLKKIKRGAEDYYTAEDDFWKIFTFLGEKSRLDKAFRDKGMRLGQQFTDMNGATRFFNERTMKEMAADLVKNNVPNYAFVSDFIKGLRQLPVGNFVAFPAEIIRTSANIVETALKEINYKTVINEADGLVAPLRKRGIQRLTGMALTTAALPLGTVAAAQAVYNIADDEIDAMRRYVADWSKNSVLVPFKDDDGKLSYIDFSHLNAYDTVTRPIQTVLNAVNSGRADEDGLVDDFVLGMFESTKELAAPFISESIWTEGLADIYYRGGETTSGRPIWNSKDTIGDKISKGIKHLADTQMPLNWKQMERIGLAIKPVDSKGKFDERGNEYDLGNELAGIAGLRRVEIDPKKSFNYKITAYKTGVRDSRNLFTAATLKGGPISPEEIVDAYINANRALYETNRELFLDIDAAKTLGMSDGALYDNMNNRGERRAYNSLSDGEFRPLTLSKDIEELFEVKAREIGVSNPFFQASLVIDRIQDVLSRVSLKGDLFPDIKNPLSSELLPNVVGQANQLLNNNPASTAMATAPGFIGQQNTNIDPVTRLTSAEEVLLDPLEQRYVKNKRTNTKLT